jgi:general secretion pathway protein A
MVLTGEGGTGKTTMLECLRDFLDAQQILFAPLLNSRITVGQFF